MIRRQSILRNSVVGLLWRIFNKIENNGNANRKTNGEEFFVNNLLKFFHSKRKKDKYVFFDVGAHIGDYAMFLLNKSKSLGLNVEIHLFEPTNTCYRQLTERFSSEKNIIINKLGVSDKNEYRKIFYDKEQSGLASLYQRDLSYYNIKLDKFEYVELIRLEDYIERNNIEHIDFIKLDIEGNELKALIGLGSYLREDYIDFIQFEYGGTYLDCSLREIYKILQDKGFKTAKIFPKHLELREYSPFMENFMYSNYVAISNEILDQLRGDMK